MDSRDLIQQILLNFSFSTLEKKKKKEKGGGIRGKVGLVLTAGHGATYLCYFEKGGEKKTGKKRRAGTSRLSLPSAVRAALHLAGKGGKGGRGGGGRRRSWMRASPSHLCGGKKKREKKKRRRKGK